MKNLYYIRPTPPLTEEQLELLEAGFDVKPNYDPRFYPDSKVDDELIEQILDKYRERDYGKELYGADGVPESLNKFTKSQSNQ